MNRNKNKLFLRSTLAGMATTLLLTAACSKDSPLMPVTENQQAASLAKTSKNLRISPEMTLSSDLEPTASVSESDAYPQFTSDFVKLFKPLNQYQGKWMTLPNGTSFHVGGGALTPPGSIPFGDPVEITIQVDKDTVNNELIFTFGPAGCQFEPYAEITLSWKDLDIDIPALYYIDHDGQYIEQTPEQIDVFGKWMTIYVPHFSRYAIAHSQ